jgi:hypothetical protein
MRQRLADSLFFEPNPSVERVVFIGTPHQGSGMARRVAGCVGNLLVNFGNTESATYEQLADANAAVFRPDFPHERPTSITLLEPASPFLNALAAMPISSRVHLHSIIGTGGFCCVGEPGDGVVTVSSARHCGDSELLVPARHERLHRDPATIDELARILRLPPQVD